MGDHAGALDAAGTHAILFGGDTSVTPCGQAPAAAFIGTTWYVDVACGAYEQLDGAAPSPRAKHAMVSTGKTAYLFGGRYRAGKSGAYTLYNDVWAFDFSSKTWSEVQTSGTAPSPRASTAIAYDAKRERLVLFGGNSSTNGLAFKPEADTFTFDLKTNTWTKLDTPMAPKARLFHTLVVNPDSDKAYLYSGGDENAFAGPFLKDAHALDLASGAWAPLQTSGDVPLARINAGGFYDSMHKKIVIFGGHDDGKLGNQNEIYTLSTESTPAVWERLPGGDTFANPSTALCDFPADFTTIDKGAPERRAQFAFAPRLDGKGVFVMGGKTDCGATSDAWWWSAASTKWTAVQETPVGLSCLRFSTTCRSMCN
jgi:hypothetical protein